MSKPYRPPLHKRLLDKRWFRNLITFTMSLYIRVLFASSRLLGRVSWNIHPDAKPYIEGKEQSIYCFWHGRLLFIPYLNSRLRPMNVLISQHRDGILIAETIRWLGIRAVYGSSSKGARDALRAMLRLARAGENLAITPDGPRGPYQHAAPGTVWTASRTGLPIVPMSYTATPRRHAKSWDKFLLPRFFSRVVIDVEAPIAIPRDADEHALETYREQVEQRMRAQVTRIDTAIDTREAA